MFEGQTALVTGSTSGIGLGIARLLAARGANVVLNGFGDADQIAQLRDRDRPNAIAPTLPARIRAPVRARPTTIPASSSTWPRARART